MKRPVPIFYLLLMLIIVSTGASDRTDSLPSWLDTIPPRILIQPRSKWHASPFHISLSAQERARIWFALNDRNNMHLYQKPYSITNDGVFTIYYFGEDDFGNRSSLDSMVYCMDTRAPGLRLHPPPGTYPQPVFIRPVTDEACSYFYRKTDGEKTGTLMPESLLVQERFEGFIDAIDSAGNKTSTGFVRYLVDAAHFSVNVSPQGGIFNYRQQLTFSAPPEAEVFYTFDPLAPPKWFERYDNPVRLPHGLTIVRYYARNASGTETGIFKARFIVDTIPPRLQMQAGKGEMSDTLFLTTKEKSVIRYTINGMIPTETSTQYSSPIVIAHQGFCRIKARAWDEAGNVSEIVEWEYKYDQIPPVISIAPAGGTYNQPQTVFLNADEPSKIFYTLDGSPVSENSRLYTHTGIRITRNDSTVLRFFGIDEAGNQSQEQIERYYLDTRPPAVRARIEGTIQDDNFLVFLSSSEAATIYYEIDGPDPGPASPIYTGPLRLQSGQLVKYYAIDIVGNVSPVGTMDELRKPMVSAVPGGGVYTRKLTLSFATNAEGTVYWRILPDTLFRRDSVILLGQEGIHSVEFFFETSGGLRSALRRNEYLLDWTPPFVSVNIRKGFEDSVIVFFESTENATIYYTIDGSNPQVSSTTRSAGNKFLQKSDRITLKRNADLELAFYAEDAAGNQSSLSVLDLFSPRVVPNVPAGADRLYDRILSVALNTFDRSVIYFERHGRAATINSQIYQEPLTLMESDTIIAFVVDASGYMGTPDTFVYLIDLPPSPHFTSEPDTVYIGTKIQFDASETIDRETDLEKLLYRWDFDGDGKFDTKKGPYRMIQHQYSEVGIFKPVLEVTDENMRIATITKEIKVLERCPADMFPIIDHSGHHFCIDMYEWPNRKGKLPVTGVSWVDAKMYCIDAGKRLCTAEEWEAACVSSTSNSFPYNVDRKTGKCPAAGKSPWKSGSFPDCSAHAVSDMVGNVWEWVEDKRDMYPLMMGGSFRNGNDAHCALKSEGTIASRSDETGFRCCK